MKLLRVKILSSETCGGLLDDFACSLRSPHDGYDQFDPLCLVGPNGAGKSQFLQSIADIFQSLIHACCSEQERIEGNPDINFELEYLIRPSHAQNANLSENPTRIRVRREAIGSRRATLTIERKEEFDWIPMDINDAQTRYFLPEKIVGYTSGGNETLSVPFFISRSGYADEVGTKALNSDTRAEPVEDTRLMLIDYSTNLEVLVANLLFCDETQRVALLQESRLQDIQSFRCIIQLAHSAAPKVSNNRNVVRKRKAIQLTEELEEYIENLRCCATCSSYEEKTETYIFDYWVNDQTKAAFAHFWKNALHLYSSFHKLAMLNDLVISKKARDRFRREIKGKEGRRFASRLPEPQDEDKVFRFERISFLAAAPGSPLYKEVDYVSLSDGEHQLTQLLGTLCMLSIPNVLFLLDEPESHFNPEWRVKFISRLLSFPTNNGKRGTNSKVAEQECILTTHAPFVPSDMSRDRVFIFGKKGGKIEAHNPEKETFGATFDAILEDCFNVHPPISQIPLNEIQSLMESDSPELIQDGIDRLGHSVEKIFLADRLRQLTSLEEQ